MFGGSGDLSALLERKQPSPWQRFLSAPAVFIAKIIHSRRPVAPIKPASPPVTVVCISDTHNSQPYIPPGDILLHAGDVTQSGSLHEFQTSIDWLNTLPHKHKILVAGNHDLLLDPAFRKADSEQRGAINWGNVRYLQNDRIDLKCDGDRTVSVFGSPWSPRHGNWAFQYPRSTDAWRDTIPSDTDILITHTPPQCHLDLNNFGCGFLLDELWRLKRKPQLHVFGHVHEGHGQEWVAFDGFQKAYEDAVRGKGGFWSLWRLAFEFLKVRVRPRKVSPTLMVNAAMVGGLRDEIQRAAVTVEI